MKKFLSILYVMLLPIVVHADEYDAKIDGIYYKFSGNEAIVYCYFYNNSRQNANAYSGSVVIPKSVTYSGKTYSVTSIGDLAFNGCTGLTEIIIPNSIVSIGPCAFSGCTGLKAVTIPNSVTSIREFTFQNCTGLTEVIIPNSITSIRSSVFSGCTGLKAITIPNSVTSIGECAFQNCTGLTEVIIPNSITSISSSVFSGCTGLKAITIPNSVTSIGSSAFSGCTGLKVITIPNSVTSIGSSTFSDCTKLKAVTIPNSMKSIPSKSFYNTSLTSLTIGTGVLSIETDAFKYDNGKGTNPLKVIWLTNTPPKGYDYVRGKVNYVSNTNYPSSWNVYPYLSSMFEVDGIKYVPVSPSERTCDAIDCVYNESAENINLSELVTNKGISLTVKQICPYLCYDNPFIKNVNLSFKCDIADYAFYGCTNLIEAIISNKGIIGNYVFSGCSALLSAELGKGLTSIGNYAFQNCSKLENMVIPNAVESVGKGIFEKCSAMKSVIIGTGVNTIPSGAFSACSSLKDIQIGNGVTSINTTAFENCSSLSTVQIPQNVTSIGDYVFSGCTSLNTVLIDDGETELKLGSSGSYGRYPLFADCPLDSVYIGRNITFPTTDSRGYSPFYSNRKLRSVTITDKETEISTKEFADCLALQTIKLGQNITTIGTEAFSGCKKLIKIVIPDAVKSIGDNAFKGCSSMKSVKIGHGVQTIPAYTFSGCSSLPTIQIPQNVTSIGDYVFSGCTSLKTVIIDDSDVELALGCNGSNPMFKSCKLDSIYIGRKITYPTTSDKGFSPFYRNTTLRSVTITDKETEISQNEFYGCTNLKDVKIGDGVTTIGDYAFSGCSSLEAFAFGSRVETIGQEAFSDCTAVTQIVSKAVTPPICDVQALDDINKWNCTLYVPKGSLTSYQAANQWKEFFFIEEGTGNTGIGHVLVNDILIQAENGQIIVNGTDEGTNITIYDINGILIGSSISQRGNTVVNPNLPTGSIAIVKIGDKSVKIVVK